MPTRIFHTAFHSKSQFQQEMSLLPFQTLIPRALRSSLDLPSGWTAKRCHPLGKFFRYRPWVLICWWVPSTGSCHNVPCQAPLGCSTDMAYQGFPQLPVTDHCRTPQHSPEPHCFGISASNTSGGHWRQKASQNLAATGRPEENWISAPSQWEVFSCCKIHL